MVFSIKIFKGPKGKMPFYIFLEEARNKDDELPAKISAGINKMRSRNNWGGKLSEKVRDDIYAIRILGKHHWARIFYVTLNDRSLLLLNGYLKKADKLDKNEISQAEVLSDEFKQGRATYEEFNFDQ
jgi:phage-related protein